MTKNYLAIDVGGTYIKVGIVDALGHISEKNNYKTSQKSYLELINQLERIVSDYKKICDIDGIGFAIPAATDAVNGVIKSKGSLKYIKNKSIVKDLKAKEDLPIIIENDANCAALAEVWLGSAKNNNNIVFLIIGTGIGGAVITNRQVNSGANLFAGEFGYGIHNFDYKKLSGDIWSLTGATQILVDKASSILGPTYEDLNGKKVFEMARKGNTQLKTLIDEFYFNLAIGIHNIQYYIDPEKIIIGGGISQREDLIEEVNSRLKIIYKKLSIDELFPIIDTCTFNNDANLLGAVYNFIK